MCFCCVRQKAKPRSEKTTSNHSRYDFIEKLLSSSEKTWIVAANIPRTLKRIRVSHSIVFITFQVFSCNVDDDDPSCGYFSYVHNIVDKIHHEYSNFAASRLTAWWGEETIDDDTEQTVWNENEIERKIEHRSRCGLPPSHRSRWPPFDTMRYPHLNQCQTLTVSPLWRQTRH